MAAPKRKCATLFDSAFKKSKSASGTASLEELQTVEVPRPANEASDHDERDTESECKSDNEGGTSQVRKTLANRLGSIRSGKRHENGWKMSQTGCAAVCVWNKEKEFFHSARLQEQPHLNLETSC